MLKWPVVFLGGHKGKKGSPKGEPAFKYFPGRDSPACFGNRNKIQREENAE